jgi:hypothetical protein
MLAVPMNLGHSNWHFTVGAATGEERMGIEQSKGLGNAPGWAGNWFAGVGAGLVEVVRLGWGG